ncbi:receptor-like cytoplasmic kinase 1 [Salvia hispanica]|uniref:receptor-like cytoplasmic kinase 1 n=1 Tax=Salvia hispanica TaxID=49212 RepID=UPI002009784F|nr:receptor-like cytoplasmic kinase 1 [Salvia hispanica]
MSDPIFFVVVMVTQVQQKRIEMRRVLKNGEDASIETILYMPKHEFIAKVSKPFSSLKHENLVELVVYNSYGLEMVLAYDHFAPRGSRNVLLCDDGTAKIIDPFLWTQLPDCEAWFYVDELDINAQGNDVYNFGKILLELLALRQLNSNKIHEILDDIIKGYYQPEAVKKMAQIAQWCLQDQGYFLPDMGDVVRHLEVCLSLTESQHSQS